MTNLSISQQLQDKNILIYGGTGFLGKVCLSMLLRHFATVQHLYLIVRSRKNADGQIKQSSTQRFWQEIITSGAFDAIRDQYPGDTFNQFIKQKITVLDGDVTADFAGLSTPVRESLRGKIDVLLNISGIVDFNPPLDRSLEVNAFGMQNLVSLAIDLGNIRVLHTSTCYVAGSRTGQVDEHDPLTFPFPKADELDPKHWDPMQEIDECMEMIAHAKKRALDAFRQSEFLAKAQGNLRQRGEPTRGQALADELSKVQRRFIEQILITEGTERAQFWGWHNIYTYTKSIGEQILCNSPITASIVRPAVIESAVLYPHIGWNEGINTSAPLIYLCNQGPLTVPTTPDSVLDIIPVDLVAIGTLIALGELLSGTHKAVYQLGTSDSAPLKMNRLIELVSLQKRIFQRQQGSNPITSFIQQKLEALPVSVSQYQRRGPKQNAKVLKWAKKWLQPLERGALGSLVKPATKTLEQSAKGLDITAKIIDQFLPFTATHNYRFSCANIRESFQKLSPKEQALLPWKPEKIDWYNYFIEVHCPGLREHVFPLIEEKKHKKTKSLRAYDHLIDMLDEIAERFGHLPALIQTQEDGFHHVSYDQLHDLAHYTAINLHQQGVKPADRVLISGKNHPFWAACYFGILRLGAIAVPIDVALEAPQAVAIEISAQASCALLDNEARSKFGHALSLPIYDLHQMTQQPEASEKPLPTIAINSETLASILFTSGTTGHPKGVMISHGNFTAMLASLARIFPLSETDRVLSVLPLHHTFEFSCGLLLPLSRGARIVYLDELSGERISYGLQQGKITGMVGVPALWQLLERRIHSQVHEKGKLFELFISTALDFNRALGRQTGMDIGPLIFAPIHQKMGGNIRFLISGGAALPNETHKFFAGLGLYLTEGYGLTEAAPVLSVSSGGPTTKAGTVGKAVPGVELKIHNPDGQGIGEVLARGPNIMQGYYQNPEATNQSIDREGWLHTGDMGRIDSKNRLLLSGRAKEVVVTAAGENIYLDDVEQSLGVINYIKEFVLVGLNSPTGSERLGLLAVLDKENTAATYTKAMEALRIAIEKLPYIQRPTTYHIIEADLPRTRTRKIKRKESAATLQKIMKAVAKSNTTTHKVSEWVAQAVSMVTDVESSTVHNQTKLREDLQFDSLMAVELAAVLSQKIPIESHTIEKCETVGELVEALNLPTQETSAEAPIDAEVILPTVVRKGLTALLSGAQHQLYDSFLKTTVSGQANIPQNRQVLVISNHCSHLDMGLVKYALGPYGQKLTGLAAQDYFFEGNKWKVAYFSQLTNLSPIDRKKGYRASIRQAKEIIEQGHIALIFPEGTRQQDGAIGDFKPMFGQIALETGLDILPIYLGGTYNAMPKGAMLPKAGDVQVRIGPILPVKQFADALQGRKKSQILRLLAKTAKYAIEELRDGRIFNPSIKELHALAKTFEQQAEQPQNGIQKIFNHLRNRYTPENQQKSISWYFSLDGKGGPRYTIAVKPQNLLIYAGKPTEGNADCVIKTNQELLRKMILESYVPQMSEFLSGRIKTSSPALLMEFQKIFKLQEKN